MKPYVVYWTNIPSPYMVEKFNAIERTGRVRFEAWFSARTEADRSWEVEEEAWQFRYRYLRQVVLGGHGFAAPLPLVHGKVPDLLVTLHAEPAFLAGWALARARGTRTVVWIEPTFDTWVTRRRWKEGLKRQIFPRLDGVMTTGRDGNAFASRYGTAEQRIFYLPYFSSFPEFGPACRAAREGRDQRRESLGLRGVTFAYVGRLWSGKGLNYLVDAFAVLQRRSEGEVSLLIAGDGSDEQALRDRCRKEGLKNVVFVGFFQREQLPFLYTAADVFVFPTLGDPFGQVVEEAMSCGLPIISSSAAGEIEDRIEEGVNGFIVPPMNSASLLDRMELLASDPHLRSRMGEASFRRATAYTPDLWVEKFVHAVGQILAMPRAPIVARRLGSGGPM
jgi:glycosyltransferase involved in cell wall biosynthesis